MLLYRVDSKGLIIIFSYFPCFGPVGIRPATYQSMNEKQHNMEVFTKWKKPKGMFLNDT